MSEENSENDESQSNSGGETEINASLASLDVTVRTEGQEECEDLFYNVWDYVMDDAEDMTDAMKDRLSGP